MSPKEKPSTPRPDSKPTGQGGTPASGYPTLHPRYLPVAQAWNEAEAWLLDWVDRHELTAAEVAGFHAKALTSLAGYAIRDERREGEDADDGQAGAYARGRAAGLKEALELYRARA